LVLQLLHGERPRPGPSEFREHLAERGGRRELAAVDRVGEQCGGERLRDGTDLESVVLVRAPAGEADGAVGLDRRGGDVAHVAGVEEGLQFGGQLSVPGGGGGEAALPRGERREADDRGGRDGRCDDATQTWRGGELGWRLPTRGVGCGGRVRRG